MSRRDERRNDEQPGPDGSNGPSMFLILLIVIAIIAGAFVLQNRDSANIQFLLFFEAEVKIWVAIGLAILLGVLLDRLGTMWWRRARQRDD